MKNAYYLLFSLLIILGCNPREQGDDKPFQMGKKLYSPEEQVIFDELKAKDSILFKHGFNECDTAQLRLLVSEDFEFYHDQSGITNSKENFLTGIMSLCELSYKPTRELAANTLEVFVLRNQGAIYGAMQKGEHLFYGEEEGREKYLTSIARFNHLWIIEDGEWRLKRVISYDHQSPKKK